MIAFLLANAVLAAALAVVVLALVVVIRRPAFAHRAWLIVVLKLVTPPLLVVPIAWTPSTPSAAQTASPDRDSRKDKSGVELISVVAPQINSGEFAEVRTPDAGPLEGLDSTGPFPAGRDALPPLEAAVVPADLPFDEATL